MGNKRTLNKDSGGTSTTSGCQFCGGTGEVRYVKDGVQKSLKCLCKKQTLMRKSDATRRDS